MVYFDSSGDLVPWSTANDDVNDDGSRIEYVEYVRKTPEDWYALWDSWLADSTLKFNKRCIRIAKLIQDNPRISISKIKRETGYKPEELETSIKYLLENKYIRKVGRVFKNHWEVANLEDLFAGEE